MSLFGAAAALRRSISLSTEPTGAGHPDTSFTSAAPPEVGSSLSTPTPELEGAAVDAGADRDHSPPSPARAGSEAPEAAPALLAPDEASASAQPPGLVGIDIAALVAALHPALAAAAEQAAASQAARQFEQFRSALAAAPAAAAAPPHAASCAPPCPCIDAGQQILARVAEVEAAVRAVATSLQQSQAAATEAASEAAATAAKAAAAAEAAATAAASAAAAAAATPGPAAPPSSSPSSSSSSPPSSTAALAELEAAGEALVAAAARVRDAVIRVSALGRSDLAAPAAAVPEERGSAPATAETPLRSAVLPPSPPPSGGLPGALSSPAVAAAAESPVPPLSGAPPPRSASSTGSSRGRQAAAAAAQLASVATRQEQALASHILRVGTAATYVEPLPGAPPHTSPRAPPDAGGEAGRSPEGGAAPATATGHRGSVRTTLSFVSAGGAMEPPPGEPPLTAYEYALRAAGHRILPRYV